MMRLLRRLFDYFPLTPLGFAFVGLSALTLQYQARKELDVVLWATTLFGFGLIAVAALFVWSSALILWRRIGSRSTGADGSDEPIEAETNSPMLTPFLFPRLRLLPMIELKLVWETPENVVVSTETVGNRLQEMIVAGQRGEHRAVVRRFIVRDVFGLFRWTFRKRSAQRVVVLPQRCPAAATQIMHLVGGDGLSDPRGPADGELLDIRRYAPGDPLRLVLWKVFARTRQLMVRTPERAVSPDPSVMAYFVAGAADDASASLARHCIEQQLFGKNYTFQADGSEKPVGQDAAALEQIVRSVGYRKQGGLGLSKFAEEARRQRRTLLLFLPATDGPWREHVLSIAASMRDVSALVAFDGDLSMKQRGLPFPTALCGAECRYRCTRGSASGGRFIARCGSQHHLNASEFRSDCLGSAARG